MIHWTAGLALVVALLAPLQASSACLPLRTFTAEERQQFESQHGMQWWKTMGLIPGPAQPGDWVERPWGDSSIHIYMPQQFWDPRGCANTIDPRGPKGGTR
ncbi:MAG: hypothetical protein ACRDQ2_16970 [Gaiellales bacterium]